MFDYVNFIFVGLPAYLQWRFQAVLNAAAHMVFRLRRYDHVTNALAIFHWLHFLERVNFKSMLMAYRVLHHMAPFPVSNLPSRRCLQSSSTLQLLIPLYRLSTTGH